MKVLAPTSIWIALFPVLIPGCLIIEDSDYDPRGYDVELSGTLSLDFEDGAGPVNANSTTCEEAGFYTVEVLVFSSVSGGRGYLATSFSCATGSFSTGEVLSFGTFYVELRAYDSLGRLAAVSDRGYVDARDDDSVEVAATLLVDSSAPPVTWDPYGTDVTLEGSWAINFSDGEGDRPANVDVCAAAGIDTVQLIIWEAIDGSYIAPDSLKFPCEQAEFSVPDFLDHGGYYYTWSAIGPGGGEVSDSAPVYFDVTNISTIDTIKAVFLLEPSTVTIDLYWDAEPGPGYDAATCNVAKVDNGMFYSLTDPWGYEILSDETGCRNSITFNNLSYGEYTFYVEGYDLTDTTRWIRTCTFFVSGVGADLEYCDIYDDL